MTTNGSAVQSAKERYVLNQEDVAGLLKLHEDTGGTGPGRRYGLEVLNKSAVVLITAFWEAFCEDLAAEALERLVDGLQDPNDLPTDLRRTVANELKDDQHHLAIWRVAGGGWRPHLKSRLDELKRTRNWDLMNPRPKQITDLFADTIGLPDVTDSWHWGGVSVVSARRKLNTYISLRGDVAHRGTAEKGILLKTVRDYDAFVKRLVDATDQRVKEFVDAAINP